MTKKYKYSRNEIAKRWGYLWNDTNTVDDLLATVPEKKCEHHKFEYRIDQTGEPLYGEPKWCYECGEDEPTPPQLPEIKVPEYYLETTVSVEQKSITSVRPTIHLKQWIQQITDRLNILSKRV